MNDRTVDLNHYLLTKNACIYSNAAIRLAKWILWSVDDVSEVRSDGGFFRRPTFLRMRVGEEHLQLNATFDRQKIKEHAEGMHGWVNRFHSISPIMNLPVFHQYIDQINQMYGVQVDSEFNFQSRIWKTLLNIAKAIDGVILVHESFIDCDGRILFGYLADLVNKIRDDSGERSAPLD